MKSLIMKINALTTAILLLFVTGCDDLDTNNLNNPTVSNVLASGSDLPGFLAGGYLTWWQANHQSRPGLTMATAGDILSCSWGNFGMRRMSDEPRQPYNNSSSETVDYKDLVKFPWFRNLSAQFTANSVINALDDGLTLGDPDQDIMLRTSAHLLRGLARGYLANHFDQAFLTDEATDLSQSLTFSTPADVLAGAVADLTEVVRLAGTGTFTMDPSFINGLSLTNDEMAELANSYAARFMVHNARTDAENTATDWNAVLDFAENGITTDFAPLADGNTWFGYWRYAHIGNGGPTGSWARLDQRLVSALDPTQPSRYPQDGSAPAAATSADSRLASDFTFVESNNFRPERGLWHFSHYKHSRNISEPAYMGDGVSSGPMPAFAAVEIDLLRAEALYMLGRDTEAAAIVNAGTRVTRGNLAAVTSGTEVLDAIIYERYIELLNTEPAGAFFDRRRRGDRLEATALDALGGLQQGTPAHFPVPAEELEVLQVDVYSFGGPTDPTGLVRQ